MNLLEVVQAASDELGLPEVTSALSNANLTVRQLVALTRASGAALVKRHEWRTLYREMTVTTVNGQAFYTLPADFGRLISRTAWDQTNAWQLEGPVLTTMWQSYQSGIGSDTVRLQFRMIDNRIELRPTASIVAGLTLSAYYVSKYWIYTSPADPLDPPTRLADFANDTDLIAFDDRLIVEYVKLKFLQAKGLDTQAVAMDFQNALDDALSQDTGAQKLSVACPSSVGILPDQPLVPDSGYG